MLRAVLGLTTNGLFLTVRGFGLGKNESEADTVVQQFLPIERTMKQDVVKNISSSMLSLFSAPPQFLLTTEAQRWADSAEFTFFVLGNTGG